WLGERPRKVREDKILAIDDTHIEAQLQIDGRSRTVTLEFRRTETPKYLYFIFWPKTGQEYLIYAEKNAKERLGQMYEGAYVRLEAQEPFVEYKAELWEGDLEIAKTTFSGFHKKVTLQHLEYLPDQKTA